MSAGVDQAKAEEIAQYLNAIKKRKPRLLEKVRLGFLMATEPTKARCYAECASLLCTSHDLEKFRRELRQNYDLLTYVPPAPAEAPPVPAEAPPEQELQDEDDRDDGDDGSESQEPTHYNVGIGTHRPFVHDRGVGPTQPDDQQTQLAHHVRHTVSRTLWGQ